MDIQLFIESVVKKDEVGMRKFLDKDLRVRWHNTNEEFTLEEYIKVNCLYPGNWLSEVKTVIPTNEGWVAITKIYSEDKKVEVYQISIVKIKDNKILELDEYYSENGIPPQWRMDMSIGNKINE